MAVWRRARGRHRASAAGLGCAGALVALLAVTGCSGTGAAAEDAAASAADSADGSGEAAEILRRAADVLAEAGSSQARTAMQMASGGTRITIHGQGGFDYAGRVGELLVTLPGGEPVTEVFVPGQLYMKNRGAGVPADKWVRLDIAALPDGNLVTGGATDPIAAAELLRGVRAAADLGEAKVNGETLRHFRGVTDINAAAEAASGRSRDQLTAAVGGFTRTEVPFDAYLDEQGLLREIRHQFSFASGATGGETGEAGEKSGVAVASTVTLYDFGTPVEVALPRAGDVYTGAIA